MGKRERRGEYRRSREIITWNAQRSNIEGAKQRQVKEKGGSYRKKRVGCGVDDGGKAEEGDII